MKSIYLDQKLGRTLQLDGKSFLFFSGTSYLGIGSIAEYQEVLLQNIEKLGFHHGLSRVNNVKLKVYDEFERFFAEESGAESAAVVSSGYMAGLTAWQGLFPQNEECWIAPDTHPAILPANQLPDLQLNFIQWKNQCLQHAVALSPRRILILGNAVDPLNCHIHEYSWVKKIAEKHEVTLLIDDSHAFGTLGESVFGTYALHADPSINLVVSGSLGKGLAMPAGIILGNQETIAALKSQSIFTAASPGSPANLQTFLETQEIYEHQFQKLRNLNKIFFGLIQDLCTLFGSSEFPVFTYQNAEWAGALEEKGFISSSFSYPTASSLKVNRIVLSGFHLPEDLEALSKTLHQL